MQGAEYHDLPKKTAELLERLLREKDRFRAVFTTERGSTYFLTQEGGCMRFKMSKEGLELQPVTNQIYFVSDQTTETILKDINAAHGDLRQTLIDRRIPTVPFDVGATPLEIGIVGMAIQPAISRQGDVLTILGDEYTNRLDQSFETPDGRTIQPGEKFIDSARASGVHFGHPIKEILYEKATE